MIGLILPLKKKYILEYLAHFNSYNNQNNLNEASIEYLLQNYDILVILVF